MENENKSSGIYIIDSEYNIVAFNEVAKTSYPQLEKGQKCHKVLMGLDSPCEICPVLNEVKGPRTYFDPIRKIYETVDAVEVPMEDGSLGHALVFSTTGEREEVSKQLPTTEVELLKFLNQEYYDSLTGSYSRKGFVREVDSLLKEKEESKRYAILMFDIRDFKAVNDIFGIAGGDNLLKHFYDKIVESSLKPVVSARLESDWFVILVDRVNLDFEKLDELLDYKWEYQDRTIQLHSRCGIYFIDGEDIPVSNMIEWAILAKQSVDEDRFNNYKIFDDDMRKDYVGRTELTSRFKRGVENQEFKVYYQPIIDLKTEKVSAAEALVRWISPDMGFIPPDQFITLFEKNGLITRLDEYVLNDVYRFLKTIQDKDYSDISVSVNLSWQDFFDNQMMDEIINRCRSEELPSGTINFEVTETSVTALEQNCAYLLGQFQQCGAKILLDDFGTGYSSLGMVSGYNFDILKIDRGFVNQIETNPKVHPIITFIIEMSHKLGLETVAEGVETFEQLQFLKDNGCDYIQGYYYSRPLPEEEFEKFLAEHNGKKIIIDKPVEDKSKTDRSKIDDSKKDEFGKNESNLNAHSDEISIDFLEDVLGNSGQFIQICHPEDYTMVYANEMTKQISGHPDMPYKGKKCYEYMLGLDAPCGHCPMRRMGDESEKDIEVDDGAHVFQLKARYSELNGRRVFIEYGRDVTATKISTKRYTDQIKGILEVIPEGQGVFHVNVTKDQWLSSGGNAQNARDMQDVKNVNTLIRMIGSFVPDKEGQEKFFDTFCRDALIKAHKVGRYQITLETESYYDDGKIRWSRITAHLIDNPETGDVESIIYGMDISKEKERVEALEASKRATKKAKENEKLKKEVQEAMNLYSQADHDRRTDFLTGLYNRLELFDLIKKSLANDVPKVKTMFMIDIDDFKQINDTYGHLVGDDVLKSLGTELNKYGEDKNILFYRYGGEEILGIEVGDAPDPKIVSEELLNIIRNIKVEAGKDNYITFTASIGYTTHNNRYEKMIDLADKAMYMAKKRGKNRVVCYEEM